MTDTTTLQNNSDDNEPDEYLTLFREMNQKLSKITEYLPEKNDDPDDHDSHAMNTETSSETQTELETPASTETDAKPDTEAVKTENPPEPDRKRNRVPWAKR